jgi:predicted signal transduction protein with EAL and GGDEF domain
MHVLAERLLAVIAEPYELDGHMAAIRASIGVALAPSDSNDPNGLLKQADIALYRAKGDGKGAFRFFEIVSLPAPICSPVRTLSSDSSLTRPIIRIVIV